MFCSVPPSYSLAKSPPELGWELTSGDHPVSTPYNSEAVGSNVAMSAFM